MKNNDHLSLCPIHRCGNYADYNLATLIKEFKPKMSYSQFLTHNGFYGITTAFEAEANVPEKHIYLTQPTVKDVSNVEEAASTLLQKLYEYFINNWNPHEHHVVLASGGADSRILLWTLRNLSRTMNLGEFNIICHEPESVLFQRAMQRIGFTENVYSVWKQGHFAEPDYFRIGNFDTNVNAFNAPQLEFWPAGDERESTVVMGLCGGEILDYPIGHTGYPTDNRFNDLLHFCEPYLLDYCQTYATWKRVMLPYLSYGYLDAAFRIDKTCFKRGSHAGQSMDAIRARMLALLGDTTPCYTGHVYNWNYSQRQADYIRQHWQGSRLFNDFKHLPFVKTAEPWMTSGREQRKVYDMRLYGLATAYERAFS